MKELNWLKTNHRYLQLAIIAKEAGMPPRTLQGYCKDQKDGHGTPYKIPDKYHERLKEIVKQIQSDQ